MIDAHLFVLFLAAATLLAITPGPGIFYVLSRSLEVLNPKTALFSSLFIPQFVNPQLGKIMLQFRVLGFLSVTLKTIAGLVSYALPHPSVFG